MILRGTKQYHRTDDRLCIVALYGEIASCLAMTGFLFYRLQSIRFGRCLRPGSPLIRLQALRTLAGIRYDP